MDEDFLGQVVQRGFGVPRVDERGVYFGQERHQESDQEVTLQLEHVLVESTCGRSVSFDVEVESTSRAWKCPRGVRHEFKQRVDRALKILVGMNTRRSDAGAWSDLASTSLLEPLLVNRPIACVRPKSSICGSSSPGGSMRLSLTTVAGYSDLAFAGSVASPLETRTRSSQLTSRRPASAAAVAYAAS
jgi:hypothetical protein